MLKIVTTLVGGTIAFYIFISGSCPQNSIKTACGSACLMMKRRNVDLSKLRRPMKSKKISEGFYTRLVQTVSYL